VIEPPAARPRKRTSWVVIVMPSRTMKVAIAVLVNSRTNDLPNIFTRMRFDFCRDCEDNQSFLTST
jgi:hypothetical protein